MPVDNPWYDTPEHPKPPKNGKQDPWWQWPMTWAYACIGLILVIWAAAYGVFLNMVAMIFCLLIITGKIRIIDMETEFPDDPEFAYLPKDSK